MTFRTPPRLALATQPVAPIPASTLELMRANLARRAEQHDNLGDAQGAEVYRRLAEELR